MFPSFSTSSTSPSSTFEPTSPATFSSRIVCPGATRYCFPPDRITAYIVVSSSIKTNPDYTQNNGTGQKGRGQRGQTPLATMTDWKSVNLVATGGLTPLSPSLL